MIRSVEEFVRLRRNEDPAQVARTLRARAPQRVWLSLVEEHRELRLVVAGLRSLPSSVRARLARDDDAAVRQAAARHAGPSLLATLARDPSPEVRYEVAMSRRTPRALLGRLARDAAPIVVEAARATLAFHRRARRG